MGSQFKGATYWVDRARVSSSARHPPIHCHNNKIFCLVSFDQTAINLLFVSVSYNNVTSCCWSCWPPLRWEDNSCIISVIFSSIINKVICLNRNIQILIHLCLLCVFKTCYPVWYIILHWENIGDDIGEERLLGCDSFAEMKIVKILINNLWAIPWFTNFNNVKLEPML